MLGSIVKDEDCQVYNEDSVTLGSETEKEYTWSGQPIDAMKYFGPQSRAQFNNRLLYLSHKKDQMVHASDLTDRIPLDIKEKHTEELYFPFAPQRPVGLDEEDGKESMMDESISCITGGSYFQDILNPLSSMSTLSFDTRIRRSEGAPTSPRSKFISACMQERMNPRASLVTRKNISKCLDLQHHGMGDAMGLVLSSALSDMPFMDSINLCDNNLTDVSLHPLLIAIASVPLLTFLNLSENKMDSVASRQLTEYLRNPDCPLQTLILNKSDVDDHECQAFVLALSTNAHLKSFDLSYNLLGTSETLNTVQPDVVTAGEAFGDLLAANTCPLERLNLGWNMIRLEGAESLARGLGKNWYLIHLDLSYNSFGIGGGEQLGAALLTNQTLQVLNLQNNNLNSSACFTICVAIEWNTSLTSVCFDGNPIGQLGAKILMQLPQICGSRVKVSAARCNISLKYEKDDMINMENPSNIYDLRLDDPYERAICLKLLSVVANHSTYEFNKILYSPPVREKVPESAKKAPASDAYSSKTRAATKKIPVSLVQSVLRDVTVQHDDDKIKLITALKAIQKATSDPDRVERLFKEYDADESGSLDVDELKSLLDSIGLHIELSVLEEAFDTHDIDGAGELELDEFQEFVREQVASPLPLLLLPLLWISIPLHYRFVL
jgi:Ca2+-binding EF-hand superfamily protein/Ran GTPase-activating protein (RanGAP) involved in mRNA processing and transport